MDNRTIVIKTTEIIHPESIYKIQNEGMKNSPDSRGNLFVKFTVIFPDSISNERQLYLKKLLAPVNATVEKMESDGGDNESIKLMEKCLVFDESKFNETSVNYEAEAGQDPSYESAADDMQCATQ